MADHPAPAPDLPTRTKKFRKPFSAPKLDGDSARRQGRIATHAFVALGREGAMAYLNTHCPALGGVPLEIATRSAEGEAKVVEAIDRRVATP